MNGQRQRKAMIGAAEPRFNGSGARNTHRFFTKRTAIGDKIPAAHSLQAFRGARVKMTQSSSLNLSALPEGLRSHGRPLSVHRPWKAVLADAQARFFARLFGENWRNAGSGVRFQKAVLFGFGAFLFLGGLALLWMYFYRPPQNEDPRFVLIAAGGAFVLSVGMVVAGFFYRPADKSSDPGTKGAKLSKTVPDLYLVYPDGLAAVTGDAHEFLPWKDVTEVASVWINLDRQLVVRDGDRQVVVWNGFTEMGELRQAIYQNVNRHLLPRTLRRISEGKSVQFGPFTLRRSGLKYKDRKASWDDITSMKIVNYRGDVRLTIYTRGRLLAWCWCDVHQIVNYHTFSDALCQTAPEHLLTTSTKPRW
jgi:hypothetical protein